MNLSILIHTFNKYDRYWPGCWEGWHKFGPVQILKFFGTDIERTEIEFGCWQPIYSGPGEWSDRLIKLLQQIPTKYVLYAQEDHWPVGKCPDLDEMMKFVEKHNLLRLQLAPVNQFYALTGSEIPLFFHPSSKYLVSHQPSIWDKEFLLSCLQPNETPWQNEYEGTKRLQNKKHITNKIAIYPCDWFAHKSVKGQFQSQQS